MLARWKVLLNPVVKPEFDPSSVLADMKWPPVETTGGHFFRSFGCDLSCASYFSGFSENPTTIQGVIDNFSDSRNIGVYIHSVAGTEMTQDTFSCNLHRRARQLGETPSLDVVNSLKPISERQVHVEIHDLTSY